MANSAYTQRELAVPTTAQGRTPSMYLCHDPPRQTGRQRVREADRHTEKRCRETESQRETQTDSDRDRGSEREKQRWTQ